MQETCATSLAAGRPDTRTEVDCLHYWH